MMRENFVRVEGKVKRDSEATRPNDGVEVMDFCLEVPTGLGDRSEVYVDVFAATDACRQVDGFVEKGERLSVEGRLTFKTITDYGGNRKSRMMVYAEVIESLDEDCEEEL